MRYRAFKKVPSKTLTALAKNTSSTASSLRRNSEVLGGEELSYPPDAGELPLRRADATDQPAASDVFARGHVGTLLTPVLTERRRMS